MELSFYEKFATYRDSSVRFSTSIFFIKGTHLGPWFIPFFRICIALRGVKSLRNIMQQRVRSRRCILQRGVKSLHCMMQRGVKSMIVAEIFPLHDDCILQQGVKSLRCIMQQGVKSRCYILQRGDESYHCMMQQGVKSYRRMMQQGINLAAGSQV